MAPFSRAAHHGDIPNRRERNPHDHGYRNPSGGISNAGAPDNRNVLLSVRDIRKVYGSREAVTRALDDVSFDIAQGEFVGVMGPSGSGKSTLLNCISTIDAVTSGNIILNGRDITQLRSRQLSNSAATTWVSSSRTPTCWTL